MSERPRPRRRCGIVAFVAIIVAGCRLLPTHVDLAVRLPEAPLAWSEAWGEPRLRVRWYAAGEEGVLVRDAVAADAGTRVGSAAAGEIIVIGVPRRPPVAVLAEPYWPEGGPAFAGPETLAAAGAVWDGRGGAETFAVTGAPIGATYADGPLADVVARLLRARADLRRFSVRRLRAEIDLRLADDPWSLDVDRVVEAIAGRAMRESYVRARYSVESGLTAPPGTWHAVSPFVQPIRGGDAWPPLPVGVSRFYSEDGRRTVVLVDGDERAWQPSTE